MRAHALREILRLRPAGSAQDDRKRTLSCPPYHVTPLPLSCYPASPVMLPRPLCHVERSEAKSKHPTMSTHVLREILRLRPAGFAQDDRKRTLPYPLCHVTPSPLSCYPTLSVMLSGAKRSRNIPLRSEAESKHPTMRAHALREILRLRPAGSAQDDRKRTLSYPLYHVTPLPLSCYPASPVMLSGAKRSRNIERSEAESKHPTMRAHALREILRLRPAGSAQDDREKHSG